MKNITHIEGRRWFQRSFGNTYCSTTIHFNDGSSEYLPYEYGYGEYCLQRACEWAEKNGYPVNKLGTTRYILEQLGASYSIADVANKREL